MARIEVPMPQMGESIAEGTVSKWLKQVGEAVQRDEPILEISTDKVDAEIPAPSSGTLVEIVVGEGATVEVGTVVAYIDPDGGPPTTNGNEPSVESTPEPPGNEAPPPDVSAETAVEAAPSAASESSPTAASEVASPASAEEESAEERLRTRSTPVVRKIAEEHGVDISAVPGSGHAGRVTKQDILSFIEAGAAAAATQPRPAAAPPAPAPTTTRAPEAPAPAPAQPPPGRRRTCGSDSTGRCSTRSSRFAPRTAWSRWTRSAASPRSTW